MEDKKTIEYLNKKIWYRLLKVIYLLTFLLAIIFCIGLSFEKSPRKEFDAYNTLIHCKKGATYKAGENNIPFRTENDFFIKNRLKNLCMSGKFLTDESLYDHLENVSENYTISYAYKDVGSWKTVLILSSISTSLLLLAFEVIRRAFYYIIIGNLFPKK